MYFQYATGQHPIAHIPLRTNALISEQPYDVSVTLHMPRTPSNLAAGNFMLDMMLHKGTYTQNNADAVLDHKRQETSPASNLHRSSRPAMLPYSSRLTQLAHTLSHLPFHLFSLHDLDSTTLRIPMFEDLEFKRGKQNIPTYIELELRSQPPAAFIQSPSNPSPRLPLQVYNARVSFEVRFHGLRYWIYNYRVLAFVVFTSLFYTVSISSLAIAWASLATWLHVYQHKPGDHQLKPQHKTPLIKQEERPPPQQLDTSDAKIKSEVDESKLLMSELPLSSRSDDALGSAARYEQTDTMADVPTNHDSTTDEHADDEEDEHTVESEDEWEQLRRIQARIARERALQRQQQQQREKEAEGEGDGQRDSGIGTSMESDVTGRGTGEGAGGAGLTRRRSKREKD